MNERIQEILKNTQGYRVHIEGQNLSVVNPQRNVDGHPEELLTLDLSQELPLSDFFVLAIFPLLTAQGLDARKILNLPPDFDDTPGQGAA
jgi:hypothetical protein